MNMTFSLRRGGDTTPYQRGFWVPMRGLRAVGCSRVLPRLQKAPQGMHPAGFVFALSRDMRYEPDKAGVVSAVELPLARSDRRT